MIILVPLSQEVLRDVNSLKNKFIDILMNLFERILKYFGIWKKKKEAEERTSIKFILPENC